MFKKLLFTFVLCSSFFSFSQENIKTFTNSLKTTDIDLSDVIPIVNQKNDDISFFLMDSKKIYGYLLNSNFDIKKELSSEKRNKIFNTLVGYSISNENDYNVYLTNTQQDKFASINFSYNNNTSHLKELDLTFRNEKFIQTVVFENKFYLITIIKNSSIIGIYSFDNQGNYKRSKVDLSKHRFIDTKDKNITLHKLITTNGFDVEIHKIEEDNPNTIELTSEYTKMYLRKSTVVFTFDKNKNFTQIVTIDLNTFSAKFKQIQKPFFKIKNSYKKTNSYLFGKYIFMIAATKEKFTFTVQDYLTGNLLKKYSASLGDSISFKNTPIIQKDNTYDDYREIGKTKKFLQKITKQNIGVSVYQDQNNYHITFGGKKEYTDPVPRSGGMMMPMGGFGGVPFTNFGSVNVFFNPTFFAYNSYTKTKSTYKKNAKSTYIKGLFDKNFNHLEGEIQDNVFDAIDNFNDDNKYKSTSGETIFRYKDYYIYGYYSHRVKNYHLIKFKD